MRAEHPHIELPRNDREPRQIQLAAVSRVAGLPLGAQPIAWETPDRLTVIVPLDPERVAAVRRALAVVEDSIRHDNSALAKVAGIHVARWVLLPSRVRERGIEVRPSLVMATVFDGTREKHLDTLATTARPLLDWIYGNGNCPDYPERAQIATDVCDFLERHEDHGRVAQYVGTPGRSVQTIVDEDRLTQCLAEFVRSLPTDLPNTQVFLEAKRFVGDEGNGLAKQDRALARFAQTPVEPPPRRSLLRRLLGVAGITTPAVVGIVVAVALGLAVGLWFGPLAGLGLGATVLLAEVGFVAMVAAVWTLLLVAVVEPRETLEWIQASPSEFRKHNSDLRTADNEGPGMNRMTILTDVKPGRLRAWTMRFVLWLIDFRSRGNFEGNLQGVETIHFAEWRLVDGGRRLLFSLNYDGSALSYFADFSENAAPGVNAIWSNTEGFPPTTALIGEGSRDLEAFENAARIHQIATDVWYCGYPNRRFTTRRINDNARVHRLLTEFPTPSEVAEWLAILRGYAA